jgi:hypothetical protein
MSIQSPLREGGDRNISPLARRLSLLTNNERPPRSSLVCKLDSALAQGRRNNLGAGLQRPRRFVGIGMETYSIKASGCSLC